MKGNLHSKQEDLTKAQLKFSGLVKLVSTFQNDLQTHRTTLNDIRVNVQVNRGDLLQYHKKVVASVSLLHKKFAEEKGALEENLRKVSTNVQS